MPGKVLTDFTGMNDEVLAEKSQVVVRKMRDNPYFEKLQMMVEDVAIKAREYQRSLIDVQSQESVQKKAHKNSVKKKLEDVLSTLAINVNLIAKGDREELLSSGMDLIKEYKRETVPKQIQIFELSDAGEGSIYYKSEVLKEANGYIVRYRKEGEDVWDEVLFSQSTGIIENLQSVCRYEFQIAGTNPNIKQSRHYNFSSTKKRVVQ